MTIALPRPVEHVAGRRIRAATSTTAGPLGHVRAPLGPPRAATSPPIVDIIDQWGMDSFPASDPPANW
jgi:hypothetical protein